MRKQYEFLKASIHKKSKETTIWEILTSEGKREVEVQGGRNDMDLAEVNIMNELGKEGWQLGGKPGNFYIVYMQREITEEDVFEKDITHKLKNWRNN